MLKNQQVIDPTPAPPLEGRGYEHSGCVQCQHIGLFQVDSRLKIENCIFGAARAESSLLELCRVATKISEAKIEDCANTPVQQMVRL